MNFSKLCRSCMKVLTQNEIEMFDQSAMDMFLFCINKQEAEGHQLPKQFCLDCKNKIISSFEFIKHAQEINETLINLVLQNLKIKNEFYIDNNNDYLGLDKTEMTTSDVDTIDNYYSPLGNTEQNELEYCDQEQEKNYVSKKQDKVSKKYSINSLQVNNLKPEVTESNELNLTENDGIKIEIKTTNAGNKLSCKVCKKSYTRLASLKKHFKLNHYKKAQFTINEKDIESLKVDDKALIKNRDLKCCPMCSKTFKLLTNFNNHIEKEHLSPKQFFCPFCTAIFQTEHALRNHKSKEHIEDKRFACNACDKRFRLRKGLAAHSLIHSDERPFICDTCHMSFKMKQVLIKHLRTHQTDRPYLCDICAKEFKSQHNLKEHLASHTGSRRFSCESCGFRASYRTTLRRHRLKHAGSRPHVCPQCRQAFYERAALNRHMRIHTGEKPYKCPNCPLAFIDHWKRKTHIMRVHQVPFGEIPRLAADGQPVKKW